MKKFFVLLGKEIRELITPMLVVPLAITVVLFGFVGNIIESETEKAQQSRPITVIDNDQSAVSSQVQTALSRVGFTVNAETNTTVDAVKPRVQQEKDVAIVVIPQGFAAGLQSLTPQQIEVYSVLRSMSIMASMSEAQVKAAVDAINESIRTTLIQTQTTLSPDLVRQPITTKEHVIVGDKQAQIGLAQVLGFVSSQTFFVPVILFMVVMFAAQMIATSIATEKENKTLETLLSTPVSRQTIVAAKLVAAGLVALLFSGVYMLGFRYYMNGVTAGGMGGMEATVGDAVQQLGLAFGPLGFTLLGLSLFMAILAALAIALILGAFAEDVKSIQGVITPLMVLVAVPYFLVLFTDFTAMSQTMKYVVYAIPFSHPFLASQFVAMGNYMPIVYGILYQLVVFLVFVYIASRIFASDNILTMKLNFGKKRRP